MAYRFRAVQHIHNRIRIDEYAKLATNTLQLNQLLKKEADNFKIFSENINPEYQDFMKRLKMRTVDHKDTPPEQIGNYFYFSVEEPFFICSRKRIFDDGTIGNPETIFRIEEIPELRNAQDEQKYRIGSPIIRLSDDHTKLIYVVDLHGNDRPTLGVKDLKTGKIIDRIPMAGNAEWAEDGRSFYYTLPDEHNRPSKIFLHNLNEKSENDKLIFEETNGAYYLDLSQTKDKKYTIISSQSRSSSEMHVIDRKTNKTQIVASKEPNTRYFVEHNKDYFYLVTNKDVPDFKIIRFPSKTSQKHAQTVVGFEDGLCIDEVDMFENHLVVYCREKTIPKIRVYDLRTMEHKKIEFTKNKEEIYSIQPGVNMDFYSKELRFTYSSRLTYEISYGYDLNTNTLYPVHEKTFSGVPYYANKFECKRLEVPSHDGLLIPLTLFYRSGLEKNRNNRLLMTGYGAYGTRSDHSFKYSQLAAVEEGWIIADAHVRGEGEKGVQWHQAAVKERKQNSFLDFISTASFLIAQGYTRPRLMAAYGTSAGGLLVAAVMNMRPELFKAVVLDVPFVDPLSNMLNEESILTIPDRDEWGDPISDVNIYNEIRSYSPYENLSIARYPPLYITAGLNDSRVDYVSILKYVARMRQRKYLDSKEGLICSQNIALDVQKTGHFGDGSLESEAKMWAFLNKIIPSPSIIQY
ncbi:cft-1 [Blepharisma stoltei]|uniref:Prolyl endopeptidase n=1 Tax=Blepharisma stoltei TaxID=1481888 RepID=A0AAU9IGS5_9CILI|nr:unnamed protein product [Blepharisma stoltei]